MSGRDELSRLLIAIRGELTQADAAKVAGLSQAKVTRAERGRFPMTTAEAAAYASALGASAEQRDRIAELTTAKASEHLRGRLSLVRVAAAIQERIGDLETHATLVRGWQPEAINGSLQTPAYTKTLLAGDGGGDPGPDWWAARTARTARLLEEGRTWHLLISEASLLWALGSREIMAAQMAHIAELAQRPTIRLGILDLASPKPFVAPAGFTIFDRTTATVATEVGTSFITAQDDLAHFEDQFQQLADAALHGDDALAFLGQLERGYRRKR
jgi:transcriptional regulator with XRE-family HTH domain